MKILIKDLMIITMDEDREVIDKGYILIKDNIITKVQPGEYKGDTLGMEVIEGKNYCAMPGLINCHAHSAMTLMRGSGEGLPLMQWLEEKVWPMEKKFAEEHIEIGTKLAMIEMLRTGTTTVNDMYFMENIVGKAAKEFGMRAILGTSILGEEWKNQLAYAEKLHKEVYTKDNDMLKTMIAPHSPYTLSEEALKMVGEKSKELGVGIHIHIAETLDEINIIKDKYGLTPCEFLEKCGIFENKTMGAHCVHLNKQDMDIMSAYGVSAIYNPQSNMKLASGIASIVEMIDRDINVCLGTDGACSNNNLNMFEEMETGSMLQNIATMQPSRLSSKLMLSIATLNGAKALNYDNLGKIKEGYTADLIMLNLNKPNMVPAYDIFSNLIFAANGTEVEYVIINGDLIMRKGEFVKIDEEKIIWQCKHLVENLVAG